MSKGAELIRDLVAASVEASIKAAEKILNMKGITDIESLKCIMNHLTKGFPDIKYKNKYNHGSNQNFKQEKLLNNDVLRIFDGHQLTKDYSHVNKENLVVWIDPLDGARWYSNDDDRCNEEVTILIGISYNGTPIAGVINQPFFKRIGRNAFQDGIIWGVYGLGVFHNRHLSGSIGNFVPLEKPEREGLNKKVIVTSRAHADEHVIRCLKNIENSDIIYRGGCGYKAILLLTGVVDCYLYPVEGLHLWDTCAPEAIIRALGGECTDILSKHYDYSFGTSNPITYQSTIDLKKYEDTSAKIKFGFIATLKNHDTFVQGLPKDAQNKIREEQRRPDIIVAEEIVMTKARCGKFIQKENDSTSCKCGHLKEEHEKDAFMHDQTEWSIENCVIEGGKTDAEGEIVFCSSTIDLKSQYVRVYHKTDVKKIRRYIEEKWGLKRKPNLIISALNSNIQSEENKNIYIKGLAKAAIQARGWIITNGYHNGISKELAHILRKEGLLNPDDKVVILGISNWHRIAGRDMLVQIDSKKDDQKYLLTTSTEKICVYNPYKIRADDDEKYLDPYHTHFLLMDTGEANPKIKGNEQRSVMRDDFEENLAKEYDVPMLKIVLGDTPDKLFAVKSAVKKNIPCLFLKGTGTIASFGNSLIRLNKKLTELRNNKESNVHEKIKEIIFEKIDKKLDLKGRRAESRPTYAKVIEEIIDTENLEKLIFSYELKQQESENAECDSFDATIFTTILNHRNDSNVIDKIKLTFEWNRPDIAKKQYFNEKLDWLKCEDKLQEPYDLMKRALQEDNKHKFANLFMDHGITIGKHWTRSLLVQMQTEIYQRKPISDILQRFSVPEEKKYKLFLEFLTSLNLYPGEGFESNKSKLLEYPERDMFFYCLIIGNVEMAKIFLFKGTNELMASLIAAKIYRGLQRMIEDFGINDEKIKYNDLANHFEELAYEMLDYCYQSDKNKSIDMITTKSKQFGNKCCFEIVKNDFEITRETGETTKKIIAHECFQDVVSNIWRGETIHMSRIQYVVYLLISLALLPILYPVHLGLFIYKKYLEVEKIDGKNKTKSAKWWFYMFVQIYDVPETKFIYDGIFYLLFLILYSYMLLCNYYSLSNIQYSNYDTYLGLKITIIEIVLIIWRFSYICVMLHSIGTQIAKIVNIAKKFNKFEGYRLFSTIALSLKTYVILVFVVSTICRFFESSFEASRVLLCFELIYWYVKFLRKYTIFKKLGPKLEMIILMIVELAYFILILLVIIIAFGVTTQALMYHNQQPSSHLLENIFFPAYLVIAGENGIAYTMLSDSCLDTPDNDTYTQDDCPDYVGKKVSLFLYTVYVIILVILAINLLIAIFNHTFEMINKEARKIWASQRYKVLIDEYIDRSILPPPFILFSYIVRTILRFTRLFYCNNQTADSNDTVNEKDTFWKVVFIEKNDYVDESKRENLIEWFSEMAEEFYNQHTIKEDAKFESNADLYAMVKNKLAALEKDYLELKNKLEKQSTMIKNLNSSSVNENNSINVKN